MSQRFTRREFLRTSGSTVLILGLGKLAALPASASTSTVAATPNAPTSAAPAAYADWRDVYVEKWTWDKVVHCSHTRVNCVGTCAWDVYVKDGVVWREEQAQVYDHGGRAGAPDFFPRGCQKGACYSDQMTSGSRLRYPLERIGARGSGKWKRIGWDQALDTVADAIIDTAAKHGPETVVYDQGTTNLDFGPGSAAEARFFSVIRSTIIESWAGVGDMPVGCVQTWGMFNCEGTSDDWFLSDYIVVWSCNPLYTRIPDVHFMIEARYRGARLVVIAPDYNATAVHADLWLNPRVESDPALGLAMAQVIIAEDLLDEEYVREQTDLPFLVRRDNGRFLRESDLKRSGRDDVFYVWDEASEALSRAPGSQGRSKASLALGSMRPGLRGKHRVRLNGGSEVEVEPVFEILRRDLDAAYTPEQAAEITGVAASLIRRVAREMASASSSMIFGSVGACKHYHSDLMHRGMALLMALTGNQGRQGGGLRVSAWWSLSGFDQLGQMEELPWWKKAMLKIVGRPPVRDIESFLREHSDTRPITPLIPWLFVHAGYSETMGEAAYNDSSNPLTPNDAMKLALERGWIPVYPAPGKDPKVLLFSAPNPLRRWPSPQVAVKHLWPKLDLIVNVNFQVSTTGLMSDLLLPAAGYYEKEGIKYGQSYLPYLVLDDKAVEPLGESRNEWWIFGALAQRIQQRAIKRGLEPIRDVFGKSLDFTKAFDLWSDGGSFDPSDQSSGMDYIFAKSEICKGTDWDEGVARGVIPVKRQGMYSPVNAICSDIDFSRPTYPNAWQSEQKESWPTLTGRQQFYLDHEWYLAAGEALPVHKEPPTAGGDYPLRLTGGHTRWSIHAIWRSNPLLMRLQRGEPLLFMNVDDARLRGVGDNDSVRVFNDVGDFNCLVRPSPAVQPGQAIIYHAWESYQFAGHKGQQEPVVSPWKSLHLAGDYGQLHYRMFYGAPGHGPRGTCVEIERIES